MKNRTVNAVVFLEETANWPVLCCYHGRHSEGTVLVLSWAVRCTAQGPPHWGVCSDLKHSAIAKLSWQFCHLMLRVVAAACLFRNVCSPLPRGRVKKMQWNVQFVCRHDAGSSASERLRFSSLRHWLYTIIAFCCSLFWCYICRLLMFQWIVWCVFWLFFFFFPGEDQRSLKSICACRKTH